MFAKLRSFLKHNQVPQVPPKVPEFSFCEGIMASSRSKWHIRKTHSRLFLSGGIDSVSLCGRVREGWDLGVKIKEIHLLHACPDCVKKYKESL
jgi:hypothetical protein